MGKLLGVSLIGALALMLGWVAVSAATNRPPGYNACKEELLSTLRSPSTYEEVKRNAFQEVEAPYRWWVSIEYDAQNAYGAPIRGTWICAYADAAGKPDTSRNLGRDELGNPINPTRRL